MQTQLSKSHLKLVQPRKTQQRAADTIAQRLVAQGVTQIFGLPGGTISPLYDALEDVSEIKVVLCRHEHHATCAALGHAYMTGEPGVVMTTSGPGLLNALTGIASAQLDSLPMVVLAGEVAVDKQGRGSIQDGSAHALNLVAMCRQVTKDAWQLQSALQSASMIDHAFRLAQSGRPGAVVLTLPNDLLRAEDVMRTRHQPHTRRDELSQEVIDDLAEALHRPGSKLLFVGSGCRPGLTPQLVLQLAERLDAAVVTSPKAKGIFPDSHRLSLGVFGNGGHPSTKQYLDQGVDQIFVLGSSLSEVATYSWSDALNPRDQLIQIDIDATVIGKNYPVDLGICGLLETVISSVLPRVPQNEVQRTLGIARHTDSKTTQTGPNQMIAPQHAIHELEQVFASNTTFVADSGSHQFFATHYLNLDESHSYLITTGLGSMGTTLGAAMGAKLAAKERNLVVICGDGCFSMMATELSTLSTLGIPVIVAVFNDERYGMVEDGHSAIYGRTPDFSLPHLEVASLSRALGATAHTIRNPGDITELGETLKQAIGPVVLDIRIDPDEHMHMGDRFSALASTMPGKED